MEFTINTIGSTIFQSIVIGHEDPVDMFVIKMLTNNEVGGLLPLSVIRKNLDMEVRYNVTSLVPLTQMMQEPLQKQKVMNLLKSMVAAAMHSEEYMLGTNGLVMDVSKIYVNPVTGESWLIYLPTNNPYACDMIPFLKQLITSLQYDQGEDSGYILQFMNAFNSGTVSTVASLGEFITSMEKKSAGGSRASSQSRRSSDSSNQSGTDKGQTAMSYGSMQGKGGPAGNGASSFGGGASSGAGGSFGGGASSGMGGSFEEASAPADVPPMPESVEDRGKKLALFGKAKTPEGKTDRSEEKKQEKPKNKLFGVKEGDAKAVAAKKPTQSFAIPGMSDISGLPLTPQEEALIPPATPVVQKKPKSFADKLFKSVPSKTPAVTPPPASAAPKQQEQASAWGSVTASEMSMPVGGGSRDYGNTIMINQNNSVFTVMMEESDLDSGEPRRASLTRMSNNQKMYIDKDILKIGKASDYVDFYIGNNPAISRSHADIIKKDGGYFIRDNNAKNHTYVNGMMIVPEQLVPISNNDKIRLANEELVFQLF